MGLYARRRKERHRIALASATRSATAMPSRRKLDLGQDGRRTALRTRMEPVLARNSIVCWVSGCPRKRASASSPLLPYLCLTVLTSLCLLPFSGRAFHIDDPLFVWTAQHITKHPLDPYNFPVVWYSVPAMPVSRITKNPPLACYYAAAIAKIGGWS